MANISGINRDENGKLKINPIYTVTEKKKHHQVNYLGNVYTGQIIGLVLTK